MKTNRKAQAPAIPTYAELIADPEIAALLDFDPVPRRYLREDGWSDELQRMFIARLARHGSPGKACTEMGKVRGGIDKLAKSAAAKSFRDAWAAAVALAERRRAARIAAGFASVADIKLPFVDNRRRDRPAQLCAPAPGQVRNEEGEWEDEESLNRRGEEARDSISQKLQRCRRLYLRDIASKPAHRAAFEILTELRIDWDKAARVEEQEDEPWRTPNMREPDMLLTAENGWLAGMAHGPDKRVELLATLNAYRVEMGMEPIVVGEEEA